MVLWVRISGMSVLRCRQCENPIQADAVATAASKDSQETGGDAIAFHVASRITQVPSGAQ